MKQILLEQVKTTLAHGMDTTTRTGTGGLCISTNRKGNEITAVIDCHITDGEELLAGLINLVNFLREVSPGALEEAIRRAGGKQLYSGISLPRV